VAELSAVFRARRQLVQREQTVTGLIQQLPALPVQVVFHWAPERLRELLAQPVQAAESTAVFRAWQQLARVPGPAQRE
jgi:hypothetical protein